MKLTIAAAALTAASLAATGTAAAWGTAGHTIINSIAAQQLKGHVPAFVTAPGAQFEIAYLGPEPDRLKGSGSAWDAEYDQGHFIDLLDDGSIAGAVHLAQLPPTREAYDTALRAANTDQYEQGYLPYSILDGWEQLRTDFAYWRADDYAATHASSPAVRQREMSIRAVEEQQVLMDLGMWGHYVGDASQPLHVTVHYNGWGDFPNPNNYSTSRHLHSAFESEFVNKYITSAIVSAAVKPDAFASPAALLTQDQAMANVAAYLQATLATVPQLYDIEKAGGFDAGTAAAKEFAASRLAAGAMEMRDLTELAWQDSIHARVGYPGASVNDVLSGRAPWPQDGRN